MAYGMEIVNADGTIGFSTQDTALTLVAVISKNYDFTGIVSIPTFDDLRGTLIVTFDINKRYSLDTTPLDVGGTSPGPITPEVNRRSVPNLNWDNTTKLLTISPAATGDPSYTRDSDYRVLFFHYKGV